MQNLDPLACVTHSLVDYVIPHVPTADISSAIHSIRWVSELFDATSKVPLSSTMHTKHIVRKHTFTAEILTMVPISGLCTTPLW
jgi:hypothetical protein